MTITTQNKELVKAFATIMRDIGISRETAEMITSMVKNKSQMDKMVMFLEENSEAMEIEILNKAQEISK